MPPQREKAQRLVAPNYRCSPAPVTSTHAPLDETLLMGLDGQMPTKASNVGRGGLQEWAQGAESMKSISTSARPSHAMINYDKTQQEALEPRRQA
jgi:hypothetical protein